MKSKSQILGELIQQIAVNTGINNFTGGGELVTVLEAFSEQLFQSYLSVEQVNVISLDTLTSSELDAIAKSLLLPDGIGGHGRLTAKPSSGNAQFEIYKPVLFTFSFNCKPYEGSKILKLIPNEIIPIDASGSLVIYGKGGMEKVEYLGFTNKITYYEFYLKDSLKFNHDIMSEIYMSYGEDIKISGLELFYNKERYYVDFGIVQDGKGIATCRVVAKNFGENTNVPSNSLEFLEASYKITHEAFVNGRSVETDEQLKERIKAYRDNTITATREALLNHLKMINDDKFVESVFDAVEYDNEFFVDTRKPTIRTKGVTQKNLESLRNKIIINPFPIDNYVKSKKEPFVINGDCFVFKLNGVEKQFFINKKYISNLSSCTSLELLNSFEDSDIYTRASANNEVLFFSKNGDTLEVVENDLANSLEISGKSSQKLYLYHGENLLNQHSLNAVIYTQPFGLWQINSSDLTNNSFKIGGVDFNINIYNHDFFEFNTNIQFANLNDWLKVLKTKIIGFDVFIVDDKVGFTSGSEKEVQFIGGSFLGKLFKTPQSNVGVKSDYSLEGNVVTFNFTPDKEINIGGVNSYMIMNNNLTTGKHDNLRVEEGFQKIIIGHQDLIMNENINNSSVVALVLEGNNLYITDALNSFVKFQNNDTLMFNISEKYNDLNMSQINYINNKMFQIKSVNPNLIQIELSDEDLPYFNFQQLQLAKRSIVTFRGDYLYTLEIIVLIQGTVDDLVKMFNTKSIACQKISSQKMGIFSLSYPLRVLYSNSTLFNEISVNDNGLVHSPIVRTHVSIPQIEMKELEILKSNRFEHKFVDLVIEDKNTNVEDGLYKCLSKNNKYIYSVNNHIHEKNMYVGSSNNDSCKALKLTTNISYEDNYLFTIDKKVVKTKPYALNFELLNTLSDEIVVEFRDFDNSMKLSDPLHLLYNEDLTCYKANFPAFLQYQSLVLFADNLNNVYNFQFQASYGEESSLEVSTVKGEKITIKLLLNLGSNVTEDIVEGNLTFSKINSTNGIARCMLKSQSELTQASTWVAENLLAEAKEAGSIGNGIILNIIDDATYARTVDVDGIIFQAKKKGEDGNDIYVEVIDTGSGGLRYYESPDRFLIDLGGNLFVNRTVLQSLPENNMVTFEGIGYSDYLITGIYLLDGGFRKDPFIIEDLNGRIVNIYMGDRSSLDAYQLSILNSVLLEFSGSGSVTYDKELVTENGFNFSVGIKDWEGELIQIEGVNVPNGIFEVESSVDGEIVFLVPDNNELVSSNVTEYNIIGRMKNFDTDLIKQTLNNGYVSVKQLDDVIRPTCYVESNVVYETLDQAISGRVLNSISAEGLISIYSHGIANIKVPSEYTIFNFTYCYLIPTEATSFVSMFSQYSSATTMYADLLRTEQDVILKKDDAEMISTLSNKISLTTNNKDILGDYIYTYGKFPYKYKNTEMYETKYRLLNDFYIPEDNVTTYNNNDLKFIQDSKIVLLRHPTNMKQVYAIITRRKQFQSEPLVEGDVLTFQQVDGLCHITVTGDSRLKTRVGDMVYIPPEFSNNVVSNHKVMYSHSRFATNSGNGFDLSYLGDVVVDVIDEKHIVVKNSSLSGTFTIENPKSLIFVPSLYWKKHYTSSDSVNYQVHSFGKYKMLIIENADFSLVRTGDKLLISETLPELIGRYSIVSVFENSIVFECGKKFEQTAFTSIIRDTEYADKNVFQILDKDSVDHGDVLSISGEIGLQGKISQIGYIGNYTLESEMDNMTFFGWTNIPYADCFVTNMNKERGGYYATMDHSFEYGYGCSQFVVLDLDYDFEYKGKVLEYGSIDVKCLSRFGYDVSKGSDKTLSVGHFKYPKNIELEYLKPMFDEKSEKVHGYSCYDGILLKAQEVLRAQSAIGAWVELGTSKPQVVDFVFKAVFEKDYSEFEVKNLISLICTNYVNNLRIGQNISISKLIKELGIQGVKSVVLDECNLEIEEGFVKIKSYCKPFMGKIVLK